MECTKCKSTNSVRDGFCASCRVFNEKVLQTDLAEQEAQEGFEARRAVMQAVAEAAKRAAAMARLERELEKMP